MKLKISYIVVFMILSATHYGQYISEIIEYRPAPGQFINLASTGTPEAAESIKGSGRGLVSLGSAGGYIIFRFDQPVVNDPDHPYGIDFTLFGNPLPEWSEPGMVYVMKDENHNDRPDDTWYVLAGSDYFFTNTLKEHSIRYYEPLREDSDISWENNAGESGSLIHNSFHSQAYYPGNGFDAGFYKGTCQFDLIRIFGNLDPFAPGAVKSYKRAFGVADNRPSFNWNADLPDNPYTPEQEGYGGDAFDLAWAVDSQGQYINLDTAHFIKVQTSMYGVGQVVGEISTELTSGRLSHPVPGIRGENCILIIEDPPSHIEKGDYQLKAYYFENGRYFPDTEISWEVIEGDAQLSSSGIIELIPGREVTVRASLRKDEVISQVQVIKIPETTYGLVDQSTSSEMITIWPNPVSNYLSLELPGFNEEELNLKIIDSLGRLVLVEKVDETHRRLDVSGLNPGVYMVLFSGDKGIMVKKFIKH